MLSVRRDHQEALYFNMVMLFTKAKIRRLEPSWRRMSSQTGKGREHHNRGNLGFADFSGLTSPVTQSSAIKHSRVKASINGFHGRNV
jgi:hypothetical protein